MLSVQAMKGGQGAYYIGLAQEDYYLEGGEPPGLWWGRGADALHLRGRVERGQLENMFIGLSPAGEKLTQNAEQENRKPGWDLTFSAPKSVSALWSQADSQTRATIQAAHFAAVKTSLQYLENEVALSRRGKGGYQLDKAGLCVSLFEHGTSRAGDPQLHTHSLIMNVGVRQDGTTGTIVSRYYYQHKMTAGAVYRAQLAYELRERLGLECERKRTWFELKNVPRALCESFSQRRQQIEQKLGEWGIETASAAAFATLETRKAKTLVTPRGELFRQWREVGPGHGFAAADVHDLLQRATPVERGQAYQKALAEAVQTITAEQSHFSEKELLRRTLEATQGTGLDAPFVQGWVKHDLAQADRFTRLGERDGEALYTTPNILEQEKELYRLGRDLRTEHRCYSPGRGTGEFSRLRREQREAVEQLTRKSGGIGILCGMAGTGKTTTLNTCRERWNDAGFKVIGAAISGKAAKELEKGSGIKSCTLETLWMRMNPSLQYQVGHHTTQLLRELRGKKTYKLDRLRIDAKTVLVIDEAGMIGTSLMAKILDTVYRQGGKVVLVGDAKQLQPIDNGAPLAALARQLGHAELTQIARQKEENDRQVVRDVAAGDAQSALKNLDERRLVSVQKTRADAISELVSTWSREIGFEPDKSLIFCSTNNEAREINRQCQNQQSLRRRVDTSRSVEIHDGRVHVGDRVLFTKNDRSLGVNNGETGTVVSVHRVFAKMTVQMDTGERVELFPKKYKHRQGEHRGDCAVQLGYAVTTHKGQGTTVDHAYVLAGGAMQDREISYVQMSRARIQTRVFVDRQTAGEKLEGLTNQMERSRAKEMAHDIIRQQQEHKQTLQLQRAG